MVYFIEVEDATRARKRRGQNGDELKKQQNTYLLPMVEHRGLHKVVY